jgi:peptidoglycan hydrolase-like protein with peptidoglycan-binding domain
MRKKIVRTLFITTSFVSIITSVSALTCTTVTKPLSKGSENREVLALQQFLAESGYLLVKPNGYFGENTRKSLIAFQRKQKLAGTGAVGPLTRGKIQEISCSTASSTPAKKITKESVATKSEVKVPVVVKETPEVIVAKEVPTIYVKTLIPADIKPNSATLMGSGGINGEKHWFEWGKTTEMTNVTPQTVASTSFSYKITGLLPSTTYYFRAITSVASSTERKGEIAYGDSRYFVTPPAEVSASPLPTVSITSTGSAVNADGSARVKWTSSNVNVCSFTGGEEGGGWTTMGSLSGEYITRPMTKAATFSISCKNNANYTVTGSVSVPKIVN